MIPWAKSHWGPGGGAVGLECGHAPGLAEDPPGGLGIVAARLAAAATRVERGEPLGVEARHEMGDGDAGSSPDGEGRLLIIRAVGEGRDHGGPGDADSRY
jgi:hypothetical protein